MGFCAFQDGSTQGNGEEIEHILQHPREWAMLPEDSDPQTFATGGSFDLLGPVGLHVYRIFVRFHSSPCWFLKLSGEPQFTVQDPVS